MGAPPTSYPKGLWGQAKAWDKSPSVLRDIFRDTWRKPQQAPQAGWSSGLLGGASVLRPLQIHLPLQTPDTPCPAASSPAPMRTAAAPPLWVLVAFHLLSYVSAFPTPAHKDPFPHLLFSFTVPFLLIPILQASPSPDESRPSRSSLTLIIPFASLLSAPSYIPHRVPDANSPPSCPPFPALIPIPVPFPIPSRPLPLSPRCPLSSLIP